MPKGQKKLANMSLKELEAEDERLEKRNRELMAEKEKIRDEQRELTERRDLIAAHRRVLDMPDAERQALAQVISPRGIKSAEKVGVTGGRS